MKKNKTLLLFLSMFMCCTTESVTDLGQDLLTFDLHRANEVSFFEVCPITELIPLETTSESAIGKMGKVILFKDEFYILDKDNFSVLVFNSSGEFVHKISNIGKGPGEYFMIYDININPFTNKLELMSPKGKLISYDLDSGEFNTDILLSISSVSYFANVSPDIVVFYSKYESQQLIFYSRSKKEIVFRNLDNIDMDGKVRMNYAISPFQRANGMLQFLDPLTNELYHISEKGLNFRLKFDFGEHNLEVTQIPASVKTTTLGFSDFLLDNQLVFPFFSFYEDDKAIWFTVIVGNEKAKSVLYDKQSGKQKIIYTPVEHFFIPYFFSEGKDMYGGFLKAENAKKVLAATNDANSFQIPDHISSNSNPILVKYRFEKTLE